MKTKNKMLALLEIAVVLCSLFLALPTIAAEQVVTQEISASAATITTTSKDDYVLGIYGNANEDDTIDMRDLTYVKLIFFGKKPETELADAKYDGKINPLDFIQIKLIIVGKEKELTIIDDIVTDTYPSGKAVTVKKPIESIVTLNVAVPEALRTLKAEDKIIGISIYTAADEEFFPEISKLPVVGTYPIDIEAILSLNPDIVIAYGGAMGVPMADLEDKLEGTGITAVRLDLYKTETLNEDVKKLAYIVDRWNEAEEFIDWYEGYLNTIKEQVDELSEDEKPTVYLECGPYLTYPIGLGELLAGGINIAADLEGEWVYVDPEWVVEQNPDFIISQVGYYGDTGYEVDDPSAVEAVRDEIISRPELAGVTAVKEGKVYCMDFAITCQRYFVGVAYMAKWFHPGLFEDLDPQAIYEEYVERFQGVPYQGIWVYPPLE